jgi:hypothetical protein
MSTLLLALALAGCEAAGPTEYVDGAAFAISMDPVSLAVGETVQLSDPSSKKTVWSSSDRNVATVTSTGLVTGMGPGEAHIEAKSAGSRWITVVTVTSTPPASGSVVNVTVTPSSASLEPGATVQLTATATDANGHTVPDVSFTWSSTNPAVATVSSSGVVTAVSEGAAEVRATASGETGSAAITVVAGGTPPPAGAGVWLSAAELTALPASGAAWDNVKAAADQDCGTPDLANQDDPTNVCVMAKALVFARIGGTKYRDGVISAVRTIVNSGTYDGRALALGRELIAYVIAADLIGLSAFDPSLDQAFRAKLVELRTTYTHSGPGNLVECHEIRPNNWGLHCGATLAAVAAYLGDTSALERVAVVFRGWAGDRAAYAGFKYGSDLSWQADPTRPVGINPRGSTKEGHDIDGVLPEEMRRCGSFQWPPCSTSYTWEALQGAVAMAWILHRQGYRAFEWSDQAVLRAVRWLHTQADAPAAGDDTWQPHIINYVYGSSFPAPIPSRPGKNVGWADWTHSR